MTPAEIEQYFQYHNSNIKSLKIGFDEVRDQIKTLYKTKHGTVFLYSLADNDNRKITVRQKELALSRILSGVQVSWAEESIKRLFYETNLFTDRQRDYLLGQSALDQKWYKTLHVVFCIAYDLVTANDEECVNINVRMQRRNLGNELVDQYFELKKIITDFLVPNFSIRNKVQHGEWVFAFEPPRSKDVSNYLTQKITHENIVTTTARYTLVNAFYQMIVDLGRFKSNRFALDSMLTPFEYFYPAYFRKIKFETTKIANPELENFISDIVNREIRGATHRSANAI